MEAPLPEVEAPPSQGGDPAGGVLISKTLLHEG